MPKYVGPFTVLQRVGNVAYRLDLPDNMNAHDVFHVSLLKTYHASGRVQPPPPTVEVDGEVEYEVEQVLDHKDVTSGKRKERQYLVKWVGHGPEYDSWEPADCLEYDDWQNRRLTEYWVRRGQA
jgi:hypothetical protein